MKPLRELRSWLGRPVAVRKPFRADQSLRCERLEDRLTPVSGLTSSTELIAVTNSFQPLRDLQNIVAAFNLSASVDLARSEVVLNANSTSILQIGITSSANILSIQQRLISTGLYTSVAPNYIYSAGGVDLRERQPNDPQFGSQYHHSIIRTPTAWDTTVGVPGVVVAILDDGVFTAHPDLRNTVWSNVKEIAGDGVDNDANGFTDDTNGWNFVGNNNNVNPTDPIADDHGTQVAGLLAAQIDNNEGVTGVAGGVRFMPLKVVGTGGSTTSLALARAISYAVQNGARIINTSINVDPFVDDPTYAAAVGLAYERGLLLVNSAGNTGTNNPSRVKLEELIVVAASDRNDVKTGYSNYGSGIDITAPGGTSDDGLLTTIPLTGYAAGFGTSMAAPLVAGVAALVWSAYPTYTRDQVAAAVIANADSILAKNPTYDDQLGSGRLQAARAVSGVKIVTKLGKLTGLPDEGGAAPDSLTSFNLRLNSPLDGSTVTTANFELRWAGPDSTFNTRDDVLLPLEINGGREYKIGTNDLTFWVNRSLDRGLYRFTARAGGLRDPFGSPVDGDNNGTAGGNLVRNFGVTYQIGGRVYNDIRNDGFYDPTDPVLASVPVFVDLNGNGQLDRVTYAATPALDIPDATGESATATIPVAGLSQVAGGLSIDVQLEHARVADLTIVLIAPDGTRVTLFDHRVLPNVGGGFFTNFTFEDGIEESSGGLPTVTLHRLRPDEPLSGLIGTNANGDWRIEVTDTVGGNGGRFSRGNITFSTEPTTVTNANGFFAFNGLPGNGVVFLNVPSFGGFVRSANGGFVPVDLSQPNTPPTDIGVSRTEGIVGRVLLDNGSGTFSNGTAIPFATVFLDFNGDGLLNNDEPTAPTDAFGNYEFPGLPNGLYPIALQIPPGFQTIDGIPTARSIALTPSEPIARGTDFLVRRDTRPVTASFTPVLPALRNTAVNAVAFTLSEPLPNLNPSHFALSVNGQIVSLEGTTLIGSGTSYSLIGLGNLTAGNGNYTLTLFAPAPSGQPGRAPQPVSVAWTTDVTPPTIRLEGIFENNALVGVTLFADEPVVDLNASDFLAFDRNNNLIPIGGSTFDLAPDGRSAVLRLPAETNDLNFIRLQFDGPNSGLADPAGNKYLGNFGVTHAKPIQVPGPQNVVRRTVLGADLGGSPTVMVYDTTSGALLRIMPIFSPVFTGGVRVAAGDVNGDGIEDIIAAAGPGGGPHVRIFDGSTFQPLADFMAFESDFTGGVFVTAGDFNGDGKADIVLSPDNGGGPRVRIVEALSQNTLADFFGIDDPNFRGGVRAAVGDLNADGSPDLLVAAGVGGGPRVAGYDGKTLNGGPQRLFNDFFAFDPSLRDGVYLAAGILNADTFADVVIGAGAGGGPRVLVLSGQQLLTTGEPTAFANFFAGDPNSRAGVRVAVKRASGSLLDDVIVADGLGGGHRIRQYAGPTLGQDPQPIQVEYDAFFDSATGGVFVG